MSFAAVTLEQFAAASFPAGGMEFPQVDPKEAYLEGFQAGEAAALQRLNEAERAFVDAAVSLDEALRALKPASERALAEALETLFAALLPALTERGFAPEAASAIARAFAGRSEQKVTIAAHPGQIEALAAALHSAPGAPAFELAPDDTLSTAAARVQCGRGGLDFDLSAAAAACLAALSAAAGEMKSGT